VHWRVFVREQLVTLVSVVKRVEMEQMAKTVMLDQRVLPEYPEQQ